MYGSVKLYIYSLVLCIILFKFPPGYLFRVSLQYKDMIIIEGMKFETLIYPFYIYMSHPDAIHITKTEFRKLSLQLHVSGKLSSRDTEDI